MAAQNIEKRLAALEAEVAELKKKASPAGQDNRHWVEKIYGAFTGSEAFKEAMELGRKYRESLRPKPRKRPTRKS